MSGITFTLVPGTTSTYQVGDLSAFTAAGGSYTLTVNAADIDDQYGNAGTGSATVSWLTVAAAPTSTAVTPTTATISYGQSFTFTATVSSSAGAPPDGSVQFLVDGVAYGSAVPLSGSTAQLAMSEPAGSYTITAEYTGDANYAVTLPAAETSATLTVNQAATATSIAPGTATVSYGESATFTATVLSPAGVPPDGSVQFLVNGVDYGSPVALSRRHGAGCDIRACGQLHDCGRVHRRCQLRSDPSVCGDQRRPHRQSGRDHHFGGAGYATVSYGESATFTATVLSPAGVPPDGSVQFLVNGVDYGSPVARSGATAQVAISEPAGSYTIAAEYTGDANYAVTLASAETSAALTVNQAATTTSVAPGTATVSYGESATFTATVSSPAGVPPDGSVQFLVNGVDYGSPMALSGATAQVAISEPAGSYTIAAEYTGDANYAATLASNETTATLTVNQIASPATNLAISPNTGISAGLTDTGAVTFTGNLSAAGMTVDVFDTSTNTDLGNATVTGKSFSLALHLAEGSHVLRARAMLNGTVADAFFDVFVDLTKPSSHVVNLLGTSQSNDSFPVSVAFTDPAGSGGAPASGVSSVDLYVSVNNGPFSLYQTLNVTPAASGTVTFTFVGQDRNLYAFHSLAHDAAGNTENKSSTAIEASTSVPDLHPPVTHVLASSPSYSWNPFPPAEFSGLAPSSYTNGAFTINWAGADPDQNTGVPAGSIALVNIYAQVDGVPPC